MSLLDDKLDYSIETKRLIKSAIQSKGQAVSDQDTLRSYAQKIRNITDINAQTKTVTPTTSQQEIEPVAPYNAFDKVIVNAVTSAIDADIIPANIKKDINILGVTGTYEGMMSREDYITALELADNILGGEYNDTMNILDQVDGVADTYTGLGGTEDEVEEILDTIIGN